MSAAALRCLHARYVALSREVLADPSNAPLWRDEPRIGEVAHVMARAALVALAKDRAATISRALLETAP